MRNILAGLLFVCSLVLYTSIAQAQVPVREWDKSFGSDSLDYLRSVIATADGGYLLAGNSFSGMEGDKADSSRGNSDYWIVKLDSLHKKVWDKSFGGTDLDVLSAVMQTAEGGYLLAGYSTSTVSAEKTDSSRGSADYWIVKVDSAGIQQWDKTLGGTGYDQLTAMTATAAGGYLLAGYSTSPAGADKTEDSRGGADYWIIQIDSAGVKQWDKSFGGNNDDQLSSVVQAADGGFLLAGHSTSDLGADKTENGKGRGDYWIVKIDSAGVKQWDTSFGGSDLDYLRSVIATADGGYLLAGNSFSGMEGDKADSSRGNSDYWIVKLDSLHRKVWDKSFGGTDLDVLSAVMQTAEGGYLLAGYSTSTVSAEKTDSSRGSADYWIVKVDSAGIQQWDKTLGGTGYDQLTAMTATAAGGYLLAGYSTSPAGADKTEDSRGGADYWIIQTVFNRTVPSPLKINFQDKDTIPLEGWLADYGLPYGEKAASGQDSVYTYGWKSRSDGMPVDLSAGDPLPGNGRRRHLPDDIFLATFMHMQGNNVKHFRGTPVESYWELAVGKGEYEVSVSVGDPIDYTQSDAESHTINIEGVNAIANFISQGADGSMERFKQATVQVTVTDGLLTLDADGGRNTKINYVIVQPVSTSPAFVASTSTQPGYPTISKSQTRAFPNPFTNKLIIETRQRGKINISIVDLMGKYYYNGTHESAALLDLNLADVPMQPGFYLIKLQAGSISEVIGIIKK